MNEPNYIRENLTGKLKACKLADRITFDDSALEELRGVSDGDWSQAELYAGTAVLDALQNQRGTITAKEIQGVNIFEAIQLMLGGKDIWDDVRYIGTQVPDMRPEGVQLKRTLSLWDADRDKDAINAVGNGKLPQYALVDKIQYEEAGTIGPEVKIPFRYDPSKNEIEAVAQNLANFVSEYAGQPQEVEDMSRNDSAGMGSFGVQFVVKEENPGKDRFLVDRNYRVAKGFSSVEGAQGVVSITREMLCKHDKKTLEAYVQSVKSVQSVKP